METTEKVVEAYVRYVQGWLTLPNVKCKGQYEIDLLAVDVSGGGVDRYHVETSVSISSAFSKLTDKQFSLEQLRIRTKQADQRRTIGFFVERKFGRPEVIETLEQFGFVADNYSKVVVTTDWTSGAEEQAEENGIKLWRFGDLLKEIGSMAGAQRTYFADDTLRTLQLFVRAVE